MQREKSASGSAMRTSDVLFAYIWQILFTKDPVSALSIVGAILVCLGVLIIVLFKSKSSENHIDQPKAVEMKLASHVLCDDDFTVDIEEIDDIDELIVEEKHPVKLLMKLGQVGSIFKMKDESPYKPLNVIDEDEQYTR